MIALEVQERFQYNMIIIVSSYYLSYLILCVYIVFLLQYTHCLVSFYKCMSISQLRNHIVTSFQTHPVAQGLWVLAFCFAVYNFLYCKDKRFIIMTAIVSVIFGFHFSLLGLMTAWLINFFDAIKNIIALYYEKNDYRVIALSIIYIAIGIITYDGILSLIPTLAALISTYLVFYIRGVRLNVWFLWIIVLYMIYNYAGNSIGGFSTDVFLLLFGLVGIYKQLHTKSS